MEKGSDGVVSGPGVNKMRPFSRQDSRVEHYGLCSSTL
jgi:hypothetical protein